MSMPKTKNLGNCSFSGCEKPAVGRELCGGHLQQWHRGTELRPLRVHKFYAAPAPGLKICTRCERVGEIEKDFYNRVNGTPQSVCKECMKEQARLRKRGSGTQ